jgi:hypothetical protein
MVYQIGGMRPWDDLADRRRAIGPRANLRFWRAVQWLDALKCRCAPEGSRWDNSYAKSIGHSGEIRRPSHRKSPSNWPFLDPKQPSRRQGGPSTGSKEPHSAVPGLPPRQKRLLWRHRCVLVSAEALCQLLRGKLSFLLMLYNPKLRALRP